MVSKFSVEQRLAILREYDAGGISLIELGAKYAVNESTLSGWRWRHLPPSERKCTVCGGMVPRKAVTSRGDPVLGKCSPGEKKTRRHTYDRYQQEPAERYRRGPYNFQEDQHRSEP